MRPPNNEPLIKLIPTINPVGSLTVSFVNKLTLRLFELFWTPIIKIENNKKLKVNKKMTFLNNDSIFIFEIYWTNLIHIINKTFSKVIFFC